MMSATDTTRYLASLLFFAGCAPPEADLSGEHVDYFLADPPVPLCTGTVAHVDRHVERVFEFLEAPLPPDLRIPIRLGDDSGCQNSGACYGPEDETVYIRGGFSAETVRHELVHASADRVWGLSTPFFNEGLATALSSVPEAPSAPSPVREMLGPGRGGRLR